MKRDVAFFGAVLLLVAWPACKAHVSKGDSAGWEVMDFSKTAKLQASNHFTDQVELSWVAPSSSTTYTLYRAIESIGTFELIAEGIEAPPFVDSPLPHTETFHYYLRAFAGPNGLSAVSNIAIGQTITPPVPTPDSPDASDGSYPDRIVITWPPYEGAETYELEVADNETGPWTLLTTEVASELEEDLFFFVHTGHAEGVTRYYRLIGRAEGYPDSSPSEVDVGNTGIRPPLSYESYIKPFNTDDIDYFGWQVALSADGNTLAVGAYFEDSDAVGIDGDPNNNNGPGTGAVYVFVRDENGWTQEAYIKTSNPDEFDKFGHAVALSDDGKTLVASAFGEDSSATGINGNQSNNGVGNAGAAYVFVRDESGWSQQAYIKASNTGPDHFGDALALSGDGNTLVVTAYDESSGATGINGDGSDDSIESSGAAYIFVRNETSWSEQAYVKASNPGHHDYFGMAVAIAGDGDTVAVAAKMEDSPGVGINGSQEDEKGYWDAGAVYVFVRDTDTWSQESYVKASEYVEGGRFGEAVALDGDGDVLVVAGGGGMYLFEKDEEGWAQAALSGLTPYALALSADGTLLLAGDRIDSTNAVGVNGEIGEGYLERSGSVFLYKKMGEEWLLPSLIKAQNAEAYDEFGNSVALCATGQGFVVGAYKEASASTEINGDMEDNSMEKAGAVYTYTIP